MLFKRHVLFPFTGLWEWTSFSDMKGHCDVPESIFSNSGCTNKLVSNVTPISVGDCFLRCCCAVLLARETALFSPSEDSQSKVNEWSQSYYHTPLCVSVEIMIKVWIHALWTQGLHSRIMLAKKNISHFCGSLCKFCSSGKNYLMEQILELDGFFSSTRKKHKY